ncbi:MAG: DUF6901 family protein [Pseudomonas sp.]
MPTQNLSVRPLTYHFEFSDGLSWQHELSVGQVCDSQQPLAPWTNLDFRRCENCPLTSDQSPACPLAQGLHPLLQGLGSYQSHEPVRVEVDWRGRKTVQDTTLQRAASSLMGAISANSGCPHTRFLMPMLWFHQPLSQADETLNRALSSYLLGQHLRSRAGQSVDRELEGLRTAYRNVRIINRSLSQRIQEAAAQDAGTNGLVLLDLLASDLLNALEDYEGELDGYYAALLEIPD